MQETDARKTAFLAMPGYGQLTAGASRGLWRASAGDVRVEVSYIEGSLLAQNFNAHWCGALNRAHHGLPIDYFAMQHADIEPEDYWLDKLIAEMEAKDLDVLGVVAPIKDPKGLTSIALARPDGDTWRPKCRLTMREVFRLPETFTSEDVGAPLLLNTGLWVCRFREEWAREVRFTINDRIVYDRRNKIYKAQVEPEDWYFSRLCHEMGLKIGATRKVRLEHVGSVRYTNAQPWGINDFDMEYTDKSVVGEASGGFKFPFDVSGWLLPEEGKALSELAAGKDVLEVGSYCGKSTCCLAQTAAHVTTIDPGDGRATPLPRHTVARLDENLNRHGVRDKVQILVGTLDSVSLSRQFDLAFIDGAHDADSVRSDIAHALEVLKPGGLLVFHDYRTVSGQSDGGWDPGVTEAVNEFLASGAELLATHATLAVVKPPAGIPLEV